MKSNVLLLGARPLTLEDIREVAINKRKVGLSPKAIQRIQKAHKFLISEIKKGKNLYGVNTGFGLLSDVRIPEGEIESLQYNLLRSHACGMGAHLPDEISRAMVLLRASALSIGHSGVSLGLVNQILAILNKDVCPLIPEQGSVGASGDLAPLSHLALVLIGEGYARYRGREMTGAKALKAAGIKPIRLGPKEGLALINGTQFMTAIGSLAVLNAEHLADVADFFGAMTVEALKGTETAFEPEIHAVRPHPGQILVAEHVRRVLVPNGKKSEIALSHENCGKVQDPYSLRCIPQVHGATRDAIRFVRETLEREINSVTDNPLVFPDSGRIMSGGNFHGQYVAIGMDLLSIAVAELGSISEQRLEKMINPAISGLPAFLTREGGLNSGFMIVQVAAASIVSENKTLCHPASVDTIPTSADKEDHVSMGAWAARKAALVIQNTRRVLAMEMLASAQGIDLLRPLKSSAPIEKIHQIIRKKVRRLDADRTFHEDMKTLEQLIESRVLEPILKETFKS
ncbi:MAG: histidine ammonia-lyase [Bdellovibrionales bacterium GWA1_52_35]|nr:MAG: histidine ammonia-lyase [Bdellovibrionales bacterium GWA1_52_35]HCM40819.1 histidine ammonia-lyase [Bdellovibrionales bacterium]